jgi:ribonucleoside-diphosphate reductase alpha subunit
VDISTGTFDFEKLMEVTKTIVYNLNNVIDTNFYPVIETFRSNMRHRPIGIGVQGLADAFALMRYSFESEEAKRLNSEIFACIYYAALEASCDLAMMYGSYSSFKGSPASQGELQFDLWKTQPLTKINGKTSLELKWDSLRDQIKHYGLRNSLLLAPMPTASTAQILGNNESIEPFTSNIYSRKVLSGEFPIVNKHLLRDLIDRGLWNSRTRMELLAHKGSIQNIESIPNDLKDLYKTVWEIKQKSLIDLSADRGIYVCQTQSLNLFVSEPTISKLSSMHFYAWKKGLKTGIYYLRSKPKADAIQFTVDLNGPIDDFKTKKGVIEENKFKTREERAAAERAAIRAAIARGEYEDDETVCINCSG